MTLNVYLNFRTQSRDAIAFYEEIFGTKCTDLLTYGEIETAEEPIEDSLKNLVLNASLVIDGVKVMFSDVPKSRPLTFGDNITFVIDTSDEIKLTKQFHQLAEGGTVVMPFAKTFWSEKFGEVKDKFGIDWQLNLS
ncbi:glyoxalase/bleomycin resistance/extradiol dioxygenase family protein [Listeria monocytogenes]|nr:glyoxalase/bleomycin resistance/extradiol dioxygenase family protein [Listeria monocytogenes]EAE9246227.1 glyoxalase/bleomycin resistance/extradiol dioxygenase family protein [Listeria monocytogenes]ECH5524958.1 glyoxalase/bleomycin resistance/extradiol dioxygenase family protein [Listeria monocytogenes]ECP0341985.1 glyoxalase/bleomycin resistance/extradiol dioxygenase family protein [Listeria monocytogenes]EDB6964259.1 glyoxalase/bleomycin resistance/extradiol dioxygenase family protein [Li